METHPNPNCSSSLSRRRKVQWLVRNMSMPQKRLAQMSDFFCCNDRQKWWTFDSTSLINRNLHQLLWQTPPICIICAVFYLSNLGTGFWSINKKVKEMKFVSKPRKKYWNKWDRSSPSSLFGLHPVLDFCFGSSEPSTFFLDVKVTPPRFASTTKSSGRPRNIWEWMSLNKARLAAHINCTNPP